MVKKLKKISIQAAKILFSAGIIYWLVDSGKLDFTALKSLLSPGTVAAGVGLILINFYIVSERWRILIRSQGIISKSFPVLKLTMIGAFFNFAMPGGVGGDVIKAFYFTRDYPGTKVVAVTSVLIDRILGLFAMTLMALVAMSWDFQHIVLIPTLLTLFWFILTLFAIFIVTLTVVFSQKIYDSGLLKKIITKLPLSDKFMTVYESVHLYGRDGKRVLAVILMSMLAQIATIFLLYFVGVAAGFTDVSLKTYFLVAPLGFMATAVPISPAGVGVGQAAFYFLFNLYTGSASELGPTIITAYQVGMFAASLSGAFFYLRRRDHSETKNISELSQI